MPTQSTETDRLDTEHTSRFSSKLLFFLKGILQLAVPNTHTLCYKSYRAARHSLGTFFGWIQVSCYSPAIKIFPSCTIPATLTIASHGFLINAPDQLLRARHSWATRLDPSLTISLSAHSFLPLSLAAHHSLSLVLSLPHLSIYLVIVILSIKYRTQNSVLLYSCAAVIQSELHQHRNQSRSRSCRLSLSWRATGMWDVTSVSFTETPPEMLKVCKSSQRLRRIYFALMLNAEIRNNWSGFVSSQAVKIVGDGTVLWQAITCEYWRKRNFKLK